jgi:GNAT superfamily N-acetyltransferase
MIPIHKIELPIPGVDRLQKEAGDEGYDFIETLLEEWASRTNRFDGPGEVLCGYVDQGLLVAVGGLTLDPFAGRPDMGRIRRVYVRSAWRNRGVGRALVTALVNHARTHFSCVRLRAESALAACLYESMGFVPIESPDASHILVFEEP